MYDGPLEGMEWLVSMEMRASFPSLRLQFAL